MVVIVMSERDKTSIHDSDGSNTGSVRVFNQMVLSMAKLDLLHVTCEPKKQRCLCSTLQASRMARNGSCVILRGSLNQGRKKIAIATFR